MSPESMPPDSALPIDVLVVAAHAPELRGLRNQIGERLDGFIRGMHVTAKTVGVGMGVAGGSMAKRAFQMSPRCVVMIGTCGVYPGPEGYQPCDVVVASRLVLQDHAVLAGKAAFPEPMQVTLEAHSLLAAGLSASGPRVHLAPVAATLAQTTDDILAAAVHAHTGCEVESLEAFAAAQACNAAGVPFAAVLGVANVVGSRGRTDWTQFERQAGIAAADVLLTWIHNGAQGLPHGWGA